MLLNSIQPTFTDANVPMESPQDEVHGRIVPLNLNSIVLTVSHPLQNISDSSKEENVYWRVNHMCKAQELCWEMSLY